MQTQQIDLSKLPFEERIKYAPYSVWIPTEFNIFSMGESVTYGSGHVNGVAYSIILQHNSNGYNETVNIRNELS